MATFEEVRARLTKYCTSKTLDVGLGAEVHAVTFQPLAIRSNQDRLVVQNISVHGETWLLLAVCDGHGGASTARHTASHLPSRVRDTLKHLAEVELRGQFDREGMLKRAEFISSELRRCIRNFDHELGYVVRTICPDPTQLSKKQACSIIQEYPDVFARACAGTTLAAALVHLEHKLMWAINVGDSTVALSTADADGRRCALELCSRHSLVDNRHERRRVLRRHPAEKDAVEKGRLLGSIGLSRAIGDFPFKLHPAYSNYLFRFMSAVGKPRVKESFIKRIISPPYLTADPSVCFVDLEPLWHLNPFLMLYSDGVDNLVNHCKYLTPWRSSYIVPSRMLAVLLQDDVDEGVEELFGYPIDLRWSGSASNRAVDILGNLVGGRSTNILQMVLDQHLLADRHGCPELYIDDTSIVICSLTDALIAPPSTRAMDAT